MVINLNIEIGYDERMEEICSDFGLSPYARIYDSENFGWSNDREYNLHFIKSQEQYANAKLKLQGYLFLNDVYEMLGFSKTKYGQVIGWIYDGKTNLIFDVIKPVDFPEADFILDFKVDGEILSKL